MTEISSNILKLFSAIEAYFVCPPRKSEWSTDFAVPATEDRLKCVLPFASHVPSLAICLPIANAANSFASWLQKHCPHYLFSLTYDKHRRFCVQRENANSS